MYEYILSIKGQICSMCIVLFIAWTYFSVKRKKTKAHHLFSMMIIVGIIYMIFDMITVYTINHVDDFSFGFNHFVHVIFMTAMCTELYIVYMYIKTLAFGEIQFRRRDMIPLFLGIVGTIFLKFDYVETPYGNYSWGPYVITAFGFGYLYFFAGVYYLIRRRKYILSGSRCNKLQRSLAATTKPLYFNGIMCYNYIYRMIHLKERTLIWQKEATNRKTFLRTCTRISINGMISFLFRL